MKVKDLKPSPSNPRKIAPSELDRLAKSIKDFPDMMRLRPIVYDPETMHVLGGNQRLADIRKIGMKEIPDEWAVSANDLTEQQKKEFVLKDNIPLGEWDFDLLEAEFGEFDFAQMGIDMPEVLLPIEEEPTETETETENTYTMLLTFTGSDALQIYAKDIESILQNTGTIIKYNGGLL